MKKVFWKKLATLLIAIFAFVMIFVAVYAIGFQSDGGVKWTLKDLKEIKDNGLILKDIAGTTYGLIVGGIVIFAAGMIVILVSTIFGRLLFFLDQILWGVGLFALIVGFILAMSGEAYFADNVPNFKNSFDQGIFAGMLISTIVPSLIAVGMGSASFSKQGKK